MTAPSEPGSVNLKSLTPGSLIDIETKSRHYRIEYPGGDTIRISGHPDHCPRPVSAQLKGSINEHGVLELGLIKRGMRIMLRLNEHLSITTSTVVSVHVDQPNPARQYPEGLLSGTHPISY